MLLPFLNSLYHSSQVIFWPNFGRVNWKKISPPGGQVQITARRARESGVEFTITDDGYTPGANGSQNGSQLSPEALDFARRVVKGH